MTATKISPKKTSRRNDTTHRLPDNWVDTVLGTRDPDLRSHMITLGYWKIADDLDRTIFKRADRPGETFNANWFYFGTWGTATVSRNIRHKRPPQRLDTLPRPMRRALTAYLIRQRGAEGQLVSRALSYAQEQMFEDASSAYFKLRDMSDGDRDALLDDAIRYEQQKNGSTTDAELDMGRSRMVFKAFKALYTAGKILENADGALSTDEAGELCARFVLYSTVLLTIVEQDLVGDAIRTVIESTPSRIAGDLRAKVAGVARRLDGIPEPITELHLYGRSRRLQKNVQDLWARFMTEQVLMMVLPTESLRLGKDIPPRNRMAPLYPYVLRNTATMPAGKSEAFKSHWLALEESRTLLGSLSRTAEDGCRAAAHDWRRLDERMNWAISLFRSRQQDPTLCWAPYSNEDEKRIRSRRTPHHQADPLRLEVAAPTEESAVTVFLQRQLDLGSGEE